MSDTSAIEVNLACIDHNMRVLRSIVGPDCELCPIVKADAYGLGAGRVAKRLIHCGANLLAVYTPDQAVELYRAVAGCCVLVLMPVREITRVDELYRGLISNRLHLTVHDLDHVNDLTAIGERYGVMIPVHLEVDTGMSRGGCSVDQAGEALKRIAASRRLRLAGVFTHFASAESNVEFTNQQMAKFDALLERHTVCIPPDCHIHVASSFAALRHKRYHKTMVRVGLAWAGYGLEWIREGEVITEAQELRPAVTWRSRIVQIKTVDAGTPVGYGSTWTAQRRSVIGLVPVGYADGYPIGAGARGNSTKGASVGVVIEQSDQRAAVSDQSAEHRRVATPQLKLDASVSPSSSFAGNVAYAPVVGAVNMDQITIDLTDVVATAASCGKRVGVGSPVELISPDPDAPNHLPRLARMAGTIPHEMLCRLNTRLKRTYIAPPEVAAHSTRVEAMAG